MTPAVRCTNLVKHYPGRPPVEAVRGLDLAIERGECFGLLGPNGAGKTTTIEIIEGLLKPTSGEVEILGLRWGRDDQAIRQRIGISLQETDLSEKLTVRETVTLFRSFYPQGLEPDDALARVSLGPKANAQLGKLSGGQRQRVAIACALVGVWDLLLLDEPTTGLDPQSRQEVWELVRGLHAEGRTVLLTTHYMEEAEQLCGRVAIINHGRVLAVDTPRQLIATLGGEHVIEFTAMPPLDFSTLSSLPGVRCVQVEQDRVRLSVSEPHVVLPALLRKLEEWRTTLTGLTIRHASLNDVFLRLAGRPLIGNEEVQT